MKPIGGAKMDNTHEPIYDRDRDHLKLLSIFHYLSGGLTLLFSCFFIIYIVMGLVMYIDPQTMPQPQQVPAAYQMPNEFGLLFVAIGLFGLLFGGTKGVLTIISGRMIGRIRGRTFSVVIAGINCLSIPFGTALGVCTFIVLFRESVHKLYQNSTREDDGTDSVS